MARPDEGIRGTNRVETTDCLHVEASERPKVGTRVYVADITQNSLSVFIVDDITVGSLRSLPPIAVNCNGPESFVKAPSGKFAYVMCVHSNQFAGFAINQATNDLTPQRHDQASI